MLSAAARERAADVLRATAPNDATRWFATPRPHKENAPVTHARLGAIYVHSKCMMVDDIFVSIGSANLNERLGMERAEAVKRYLYEQHQVPLHKINVISYGEDKPVAPNTKPDGTDEIQQNYARVGNAEIDSRDDGNGTGRARHRRKETCLVIKSAPFVRKTT